MEYSVKFRNNRIKIKKVSAENSKDLKSIDKMLNTEIYSSDKGFFGKYKSYQTHCKSRKHINAVKQSVLGTFCKNNSAQKHNSCYPPEYIFKKRYFLTKLLPKSFYSALKLHF